MHQGRSQPLWSGPALVLSPTLLGERVMAAPVPFLFYLGKDFGAEICCHPCPFRV
jgi:hypothetical protein